MGAIEKRHSGDALAADLAEYYSNNLSDHQISLLKAAQSAMLSGYRLCLEENNFSGAMDQFLLARSHFAEAGDLIEAEAFASYFVAYCLYVLERKAEADLMLQRVGEFCHRKEYRWFALMNDYWRLITRESIGLISFTEARRNHEDFLQTAREMDDQYMIQKFLLALVRKNSFVRNEQKAINYSGELLASSNQSNLSVRQRIRNLDTIINAFRDAGYSAFSRALVLEGVAIAKSTTDPAFVIGAELNAGIVHMQADDLDGAERWLSKAQLDAEALPKEAGLSANLASILLNLGRLEYKRNNYRSAKSYFDRTLEIAKSRPLVYETKKSRLKALLRLGEEAELNTEIPLTLALAEDYRKTILEERERIGFFKSEQEIYDLAVDFAIQRNDFVGAYDLAETTNSRSFLDWLENGVNVTSRNAKAEVQFDPQQAVPLGLAELRLRMPDEVQILQYRVLENEVRIWLISRDQFFSFSSAISSTELEKKVLHYTRLVQSRDPSDFEEATELSKALYSLLIQPAHEFLNPEKEICLVPHRFLNHLPYSALQSPEDKYFVEEFTSFYSPSANILVRTSDLAQGKSATPTEKILSIGNPAFDAMAFPGLANLPDSRDEALNIAIDYPISKVLYGPTATKTAFKQSYRDYEVIHFAGHYLIEPGEPLGSRLVMAKVNDDVRDGVLTSAELIEGKMKNAKLVVLAACQTGIEGDILDDEFVGLSRIFLVAGVPLVIASEWPVDSAATSELMKKFHSYRTKGKLSSVKALRRAQTEMAREPNSSYSRPFYWAAFAAFGGHARF